MDYAENFSHIFCRVSGVTPGKTTWRMFTYKELHTATNGFSDDNKLGEGGFGSVYWGKTSDGLQVSIYIYDPFFFLLIFNILLPLWLKVLVIE